MAAELLDIEARLDTSQVQGQLNQLSKTSGLQNLDRAIRTLENSMKKLASAMERQAQSANSAPMTGGGASGGIARNWWNGRRIRAIGGYFIGNSISQLGNMMEESGNGAGAGISLAGRAIKNMGMGAASGSLLLGPVGALAGAGLGGLKFVVDEVTASMKALAAQADQAAKNFEKAFSRSQGLQMDYQQRMFAERVSGMSGAELRATAAAAEGRLSGARANEASVQRRLRDFESTTEWKNTLKYAAENKLQSKEFTTQAKMLQEEYDLLVKKAQNAAQETRAAEQALGLVQRRMSELEGEAKAAAREEERLAEAQLREAVAAERTRGRYSRELGRFQGMIELDQLKERLGGMSQKELQRRLSGAQSRLKNAQSEYGGLLERAMKSDTPERFADEIDRVRDKMRQIGSEVDVLRSGVQAPVKTGWNPEQALGGLNAAERAGYFTMAGKDRTIEDVTQQILTYVRQITANTSATKTTADTIYGYGV